MGKAKDEFRIRLHLAVERVLNHVDDETVEAINNEMGSAGFMAEQDKSLFEPTPVGQQIIDSCELYRKVHEKSPDAESGYDYKAASNPRNRRGYQLTQDNESDLGRLMNATLIR